MGERCGVFLRSLKDLVSKLGVVERELLSRVLPVLEINCLEKNCGVVKSLVSYLIAELGVRGLRPSLEEAAECIEEVCGSDDLVAKTLRSYLTHL